jgi:hypothetical protein
MTETSWSRARMPMRCVSVLRGAGKKSVVFYLQVGSDPRFWCRQCEKAWIIWQKKPEPPQFKWKRVWCRINPHGSWVKRYSGFNLIQLPVPPPAKSRFLTRHFSYREVWNGMSSSQQSWHMFFLLPSLSLTHTHWARSQNCEKRLLASSCLSVCPSVRMEQLDSHWTDCH